MSTSKLEEICCPCGEKFEAELWNSINAVEDPDLKEALKCGEVNVVCCPKCGQMFYAENFVLYHDSAHELIAFVYPSSFASQASYWTTKMKEDFKKAMENTEPEQRVNYEPVIIFGLDELANIIREEEEEQDEVAILEYMARDFGFSLLELHPFLARPLQLPSLLPSVPVKGGTARDEILAGIRLLLQHNEHLTRYRKLLKSIEANEKWTLDKKLIKKKRKSAVVHGAR